ncbi:hypothetical protein HED52_03405 [Ochrobactrum ciceri]|uniref:Uncharacterized protein n=1 Tax=Brucella ciceri TaxID=391287 RepID=A0ABX1DS68_9HYPH|nr:hypothetical protein [Brucella ciceri]
MIQSALFFIFGVLVTVFVVVLLGPSVWRRAFFLARRQVQAELPITLAEIAPTVTGCAQNMPLRSAGRNNC